MLLKSIHLNNFRNYSNEIIEMDGADAIFFIGKNGQGKTNLLESLYYLSYGNSFRAKKEEEIIKHGESFYRVCGVFESAEIEHTIEIIYSGGRKKINCNNKLIQNRKEMLNTFPCLVFKHSDIFFVAGSPEYQRQYLDQILVLNHMDYTIAFQGYKKILLQKNAALKKENFSVISIYNEQIIEFGMTIINYRKKIVRYINSQLERMFSYIFGEALDLKMYYSSSWDFDENEDIELVKRRLLLKHSQNFDQEKKYKTTLSGPHRDQIKIFAGDREFKHMASTGQVRIISLILRSIQATYYYQLQKKPLIYLFDDVMLELDTEKQKRFLEILPETKQSFFTFLPVENLPLKVVAQKKKFFDVEKGRVDEKIL